MSIPYAGQGKHGAHGAGEGRRPEACFSADDGTPGHRANRHTAFWPRQDLPGPGPLFQRGPRPYPRCQAPGDIFTVEERRLLTDWYGASEDGGSHVGVELPGPQKAVTPLSPRKAIRDSAPRVSRGAGRAGTLRLACAQGPDSGREAGVQPERAVCTSRPSPCPERSLER